MGYLFCIAMDRRSPLNAKRPCPSGANGARLAAGFTRGAVTVMVAVLTASIAALLVGANFLSNSSPEIR